MGVYRPWPWTLNIREKPYYFNTREEAYKRLKHELETGNQNVAVGLMQIYWLYNKSYFNNDPWLALDPYRNIDAGAQVLMFFYKDRGSFEEAVGAYYSPNDVNKASVYKEKVRDKLSKILAGNI